MVRWTLSVADQRPGLSILLFHRVLAVADPFRTGDMTAAQFDAVVARLARTFSVLPLEEGIERLRNNSLPKAALSITFDDGYQDNLDVALPILVAHGLTATFFIATGFLDGGWMWNDRIIEACKRTSRTAATLPALGLESIELGTELARVAAAHGIIGKAKHLPFDQRADAVAQLEERLDVRLDRGPMLDPDSVRRLRGHGMTIGAHTVTHPILAGLDDARARAEIHDSRDHLVEILREPVRLFAYPNGRPGRDYGMKHVDMIAEAGFASAVSTTPMTARPGMSRYELPRFTPWDRSGWRFAARLAYARMSDGQPGIAGA
jgi:peptidoglycan/xylan/chitin deacetylase (PgdA/CDA1 family)